MLKLYQIPLQGINRNVTHLILDFFYMNSGGPRSKNFTEAVVVQFSNLEPDMPDSLEDNSGSVDIPTITAEWGKPSGNGVFTCTQLPLNLIWVFTIHKSQGKTLERLAIDLGLGDKCSGTMLVALLRVRMFKHFLLKPFNFE